MTAETESRRRVLLVEDEALIAMLMEDMLGEFDCEVVATVGELGPAIEAASTQPIDLAFLDVNLHGVPVYPVAEVLRTRGIPYAFVTGYGSAGTQGEHGDVPVLQKPFQTQELAAIVERLRPQR